MANFIAILFLSGLAGLIFGWVGFTVVFVVCLLAMAGKNNDKNNKTIPITTHEPMRSKVSNSTQSKPTSESSTESSFSSRSTYESTTLELFSRFLSYCPAGDTSMLEAITKIVRKDQFIINKSNALETISATISKHELERTSSQITFLLRTNAATERIIQLPSAMRMQFLENLNIYKNASDENLIDEVKELVASIRKRVEDTLLKNSVEEFVMRSGDIQAMQTINRMRGSPKHYMRYLKNGAKNNSVLKIAFGVFAGILAADVVRAALTESMRIQALAQLDQAIDEAGGLQHIHIPDSTVAELQGATDLFDDNTHTADNLLSPEDQISINNDYYSTDPTYLHNEDVAHAHEDQATQAAGYDDNFSSTNSEAYSAIGSDESSYTQDNSDGAELSSWDD